MPSEQLRRRALRDAGLLFYREGITATGVNRVAAELGMSKRTLYELFGSKDALAAAALDDLDPEMFTGPAEAAAADPAEQLQAVFAVLHNSTSRRGFRGCPYLNAAHELADPDHPARAVVASRKSELRGWMRKKARQAGLNEPGLLADQLMVVFDGVLARAAVARPTRDVGSEIAAQLIQRSTKA